MSERGSFITEFIYCDSCLETCRDVLCHKNKHLYGVEIQGAFSGKRIIAGRIGELYPGGELVRMEFELISLLESRLCHSVRIAVLADNGESRVFTVGHESVKITEYMSMGISANQIERQR